MKRTNKFLLSFILFILVLSLSSCTQKGKKVEYYSNEENYIEVSGTINHVVFNDESQSLYIGFSNLSETLDDICFKIVGENYSIIIREFKNYVEIGKVATFITAPRYFGDAYVMPIVSLSIDGTQLLEYEEGLSNFLVWLKNS